MLRAALWLLPCLLAAVLIGLAWRPQPAVVSRETERLIVVTIPVPVIVYEQVTITPSPRPTRTPTPIGYQTPAPRPTATPTPIPMDDARPASPGELIGGERQWLCTGQTPGGC